MAFSLEKRMSGSLVLKAELKSMNIKRAITTNNVLRNTLLAILCPVESLLMSYPYVSKPFSFCTVSASSYRSSLWNVSILGTQEGMKRGRKVS
jgi:hypothetical protein